MTRTLQLFLICLTASTSIATAFTPTVAASNHPFVRLQSPTPLCNKPTAALTIRGGGSQLGSGLGEAWAAYSEALDANPLAIKSVTAFVILGAADLAGQALENARKEEGEEASPVDLARVARFAIFGLVLQAPWNHFYYNILDGVLPPTADPFTATTGIKTVIDQFVQAPIFTVLIFAFLGILEGKAVSDIQNQLKNDYKDTIVANWKLWVPATFINLAFVPPLFRVLYLNCVFFFWSIYLSLILNKKEE